jgi:Na+-driven multidrug efflux pump
VVIWMSVKVQIITTLVQLAVCYVFIIQFQWGVFGAALASNIVSIGNMVIQDLWISLYAE